MTIDHALELRQQARFVELLAALTARGAATWAAADEPGFALCLIGDDLIAFEIHGGTAAAHVAADQDVHGIAAHCRGVSYLWLEGVAGWDTLLALLRDAPCDRDAFYALKRRVRGVPVAVLERHLAAACDD